MLAQKITIQIVTCRINTSRYSLGEKLLKSSVLNAENIRNTLEEVVRQENFSVLPDTEKCILNLGVVPAVLFETHFNPLLAKAFTKYLSREQKAVRRELEWLQHGASTTESLTSLAALTGRDETGLYSLALSCLQSQALQQPVHGYSTRQLKVLLKRLMQEALQHQAPLPAIFYSRVTASRLALAALGYLLNDRQGRRWLSEHHPNSLQVQTWGEAIVCGEVPAVQVVSPLLTGLEQPAPSSQRTAMVRNWLLPLWQRKSVRDAIARQSDKAVVKQLEADFNRALSPRGQSDVECRLPVSNAGVVVLWPLLPQLFSLLAFTRDGQFISEGTRRQAALSLDWLAWAEEQPAVERLPVNQVICGVPLDEPVEQLTPLTEQQRWQIDEWLTAVGRQLPAWQTLSLTDIRVLFLQRSGEISCEFSPPEIAVKPEPFDLLLGAWPWPLTLAQLPWLDKPLTISWPLHNL